MECQKQLLQWKIDRRIPHAFVKSNVDDPKHTPSQSLSAFSSKPVLPPTHTLQSSVNASPKQSPAQSF